MEEFSVWVDDMDKHFNDLEGSDYITSDERREKIFNGLDRDGDNQISNEEFLFTDDPTTDYGWTDEEYKKFESELFETNDKEWVVYSNKKYSELNNKINEIYPSSLDTFYIANYFIKWTKTSWTYSI